MEHFSDNREFDLYRVFINRHSPHLVTMAVKHVITYKKFIMSKNDMN